MRRLKKHIVAVWNRYERHISVAALASGFAFDLYLAKSPESVSDNLLLLAYLLLAGAIIIVLNRRTRRQMEKSSPTEPLILTFVLQFCFGGLASSLLILYGKSGTAGTGALFVLLLAGFLIGNELLKSRYAQLQFTVGIYYFLLLTYVVMAIPTFILHRVGTGVFIVSGLVSVVYMACFIAIIFVVVFRRKHKRYIYELSGIVLGVYVLFTGLYFTNVIPPVPLSLKQGGIYHTLLRDTSGNYTVTFEAPPRYVFWRDTSATFTYGPEQTAYCFSAVYAPSNLATSIVHRWQQYDEQKQLWETKSVVSFPINGGREGGYRGWSLKVGLAAGKWRCNVETTRGQLIGRIRFDAVEASTLPALSTTTL